MRNNACCSTTLRYRDHHLHNRRSHFSDQLVVILMMLSRTPIRLLARSDSETLPAPTCPKSDPHPTEHPSLTLMRTPDPRTNKPRSGLPPPIFWAVQPRRSTQAAFNTHAST